MGLFSEPARVTEKRRATINCRICGTEHLENGTYTKELHDLPTEIPENGCSHNFLLDRAYMETKPLGNFHKEVKKYNEFYCTKCLASAKIYTRHYISYYHYDTEVIEWSDFI